MLIYCAYASWLCQRLRERPIGPTRGRAERRIKTGFIQKSVLRWSGGYVEVSEPDPIPNSVVKRLRADGTSS
jgi:hypothetical protein